jgi:hypothetical protein
MAVGSFFGVGDDGAEEVLHAGGGCLRLLTPEVFSVLQIVIAG